MTQYYDSHAATQNWVKKHIPNNANRVQTQSGAGWGTQTGGTGATAGGQYQWSDRGYANFPEPMVPVATGYQTGAGLVYGASVPMMSAINQGINNLSSTQMQILIQAASNHHGWDARKSLQSTLPVTWQFAVDKAVTEGVDPFEVLSWMARGSFGARLSSFPSIGENVLPQVDISGDTSSSSSSSYGGGGGGGGTTTVVTTNVTSPDSARRLVNQALTGYLGREATGDERRKFLEALNEAERANPTVQTISMEGNTQSQVVEQGLDVGAFTERYAQSRPDYAEFRAATDLMDTFLGILEGPVS